MGECPIGWKRVPIIDLCAKHTDCVNRTAPIVDYETPYKMIRTSNIKNGFIDCENVRYVTEEIFKKWTRRLIPKMGDIILTREAPLGDVGKIRTEDSIFLGQRLYHFRVNPNYLNEDFLLYSLLADDLQGQIQGFGSGATVEHMRLADIPNLTINIPPIKVQNKIATILSAYDDLIENNTRRIKIIEEMAQNLYREWFVKFRFPGHEHARFVDSPLGQIPEGWEVLPLSEVCHLIMGQSPKSEYYNTTKEGLPFHQGVTDFGDRYPSDRIYCTVKNRIAERGDVLFSVRAPVGRINIANKMIVVGRGLSSIRHRNGYQWFIFHNLKEIFKEDDMMGGGTIFKSVTKNDMEKIDCLSPNDEVINLFESFVQPIEHEIEILTQKNTTLRTTRDLLLPKLISGEVDISDINITVPVEVEA